MKAPSNLPPGVSEFDDHINPTPDQYDELYEKFETLRERVSHLEWKLEKQIEWIHDEINRRLGE